MYVCLYQKRFTDKGSNDTGSNDIGSNDTGSNDKGSKTRQRVKRHRVKRQTVKKCDKEANFFKFCQLVFFLLLFMLWLGTFWAERCG